MVWRFTLPMPPQRANARGGWRVHHRLKGAYWKRLDAIQLCAHDGWEAPPPPREPATRATARATMYLHNPMDPFNCGARLKWVEDWLVTRGYLLDDRLSVLEWLALPEQIIDRQRPRVVLEIVTLAPAI